MVEQIIKDIYRIPVTLPNNPLKELNSYFIRGEERDVVIDTGFRCQECLDAMTAGLKELGADKDRLDVLNTHLHSDHTGLDGHVVGTDRHFYINEIDMKVLENVYKGSHRSVQDDRFRAEGFPADLLVQVQEENPARKYMQEKWDDRYRPLKDGEQLQVGKYTLEVVSVPGHTPGNTMFWIEQEGIMFTGDHILFDITPNITNWVGVEDSLGDYLDSLRKAKEYPVKLALPSHRHTGDYHQRIDQLLAHHEYRLNEAEDIVRKNPGMTAYEIAGRMQWKIRARNWEEFPGPQKWFAVGECISHMDYLVKRGRVCRTMEDGCWRYYGE